MEAREARLANGQAREERKPYWWLMDIIYYVILNNVEQKRQSQMENINGLMGLAYWHHKM